MEWAAGSIQRAPMAPLVVSKSSNLSAHSDPGLSLLEIAQTQPLDNNAKHGSMITTCYCLHMARSVVKDVHF